MLGQARAARQGEEQGLSHSKEGERKAKPQVFGQVSFPSSPFPEMGQLFQHHPNTLHQTEPSQQGFMHMTTAKTRGRRK